MDAFMQESGGCRFEGQYSMGGQFRAKSEELQAGVLLIRSSPSLLGLG